MVDYHFQKSNKISEMNIWSKLNLLFAIYTASFIQKCQSSRAPGVDQA